MTSPTSAPAVSILIPAYKVSAYIGRALDSILAQTFRDYEIVVINDGCPETSKLERAIEPYRKHITYICQENRGVGAARNAGVLAARADLIAQLDPDDWWEPNCLEVQMGQLAKNPELSFVYPDGWFFGDPALEGSRLMHFNPSIGDVTFSRLVEGKVSVVYSVLARKDAIMRAGNFDPDMRTSEDFDLWLRILHSGGRAGYHHTPLLHYQIRGGSLTSNSLWTHTWAIRVLDKLEATLSLNPEEQASLRLRRCAINQEMDVLLGKQAIEDRDWTKAKKHLRRVAETRRESKLSLVLFLLNWCPWLLAAGISIRDQMLKKGLLRAKLPQNAQQQTGA